MSKGTAERVFYTDPIAYILAYRGMIFGMGAVVLLMTVMSQWTAGRFPDWADLGAAIALPVTTYGFLAALTWLGCSTYPVYVGPGQIGRRNMIGVRTTAHWSAIRDATVRDIQGITYLYLDVEGRRRPLTLPAWLGDPESFLSTVREFGGVAHPLTRVLMESGFGRHTNRASY